MTILEQALAYLERGWSVIPLRGKRPMLASWQEYQTRRATSAEVMDWWSLEPKANIGIVTGKVSGLVVIDFDNLTAFDIVGWLQARNIDTDDALGIAKTGKGVHLYYDHPGGVVKNGVRLGRLGEADIDVRADGGYVVAPPSVHPDTSKAYEWLVHPAVPATGPYPLPQEFRTLITQRESILTPAVTSASSTLTTVDTDLVRLLAGVAEGGRNQAAAQVCGWFLKVTHGDEHAALTMLHAWNRHNQPPLPESELLRTFDSIASRNRTQEVAEAVEKTNVLSGAAWAEAARHSQPRHGVPALSLPSLDRVGGLVSRDLLLLAGRPGMGKSTVAWGTVYDAGCAGLPTMIFSTEMTADDVARWLASKMHRTPVADLTEAQWEAALTWLAKSPLTICDQGAMTVEHIVQMVKARPEVRYVVIDHIQRIRCAKGDSRNQELEYIASTLKSLAKDHPCTVLALSQMNRSGDTNERPRLGMLRDSGGLEQEADAVIFLWSPADDPTANPLEVEFFLAKNRHGALDAVPAVFHKDRKYFEIQDSVRHLEVLRREAEHRKQLQALLAI